MSVFVMCAATVLFFSDMDTRMKAEPKSAAEFYAVYKRYNLWLPPKNAKLIRWFDTEQKLVNLDILVRAKSNTEPAIIHTRYTEYDEYRESRLMVVSPTISAIDGIDEYFAENWLALAAWSHHLGWTDLAAEAFSRGKKCTGSGQLPDDVTGNPCHTLAIVRKMAWEKYTYSLVEKHTNRSYAYSMLKKICDDDWHYQVGESELIVDLERTLCKTNADLGGIEKYITKLCDEDANLLWHADLTGSPTAYDEICHLGFDAVPFLIAHLNDTRLTKSTYLTLGTGIQIVRVGGVCCNILHELSDSEYNPEYDASPEKRQRLAALWFANAKKIGEEQWASTRAIHMRTNNPALLRLLAAKYPKRLIEIYRDSLKNKPELRCQIAVSLARANLAVATKIDWLLEGAHHPRKIHRLNAIASLEVVDKINFTRALTRHFIQLADECQTTEELEFSNVEADLVMKSDDGKCWDAFIRRLKNVSPSSRVSALSSLAVYRPFELTRYAQHFRVLEYFWDDQTNVAKNFVVCDSVTLLFAEILGIELPSKTDRSPEEWTTIRHRVRAAWSAYKNRGTGG